MKVYAYWCEPISRHDDEAMLAQLALASEYRRALADNENRQRRETRALLAEIAPSIGRKEIKRSALWRYASEIAHAKEPKAVEQALKHAADGSRLMICQRGLDRLRREILSLTREAQASAVYADRSTAIRVETQSRGRDIRRVFSSRGLAWGTYLHVEDAHSAACRATYSWLDVNGWSPRSEGAIAVTQPRASAITTETVMGATSSWTQIGARLYALGPRIDGYAPASDREVRNKGGHMRAAKLRELQIRVGSEGPRKDPVWARFHVLLHRDLPPGRIAQVRIHRTLTGVRPRYSAQFVVEHDPQRASTAPTGSVVGVDIGWRRVDGGIRVAYAHGSDGVDRQLVISDGQLRRRIKSDELRSIRDQHQNTLRPRLVALRESAPAWFRTETQTLHAWRRVGRYVRLHRLWAEQRWDGDAEMFDAVTAWLKKDRHLLQWQENNRRRLELHVRGEQAKFVADLRRCYETIAVESTIRIDRMRDRATAGNEQLRRAAVANTVTSPGALRDALVKAGAVEIDPAHTTTDCAACGHRREVEDRTSLVLRCEACGVEEDQDRTAARNLLRAARSGSENGKALADRNGAKPKRKLGARRNRRGKKITA